VAQVPPPGHVCVKDPAPVSGWLLNVSEEADRTAEL
jgi:hypothetical protein